MSGRFQAAESAYRETLADLRLSEGGGFKVASQHRRSLEAALDAAEAVMFSDATIDRIARSRYMKQRHIGDQDVWEDRAESVKDKWRAPVRSLIAALREES